MRHLAISLLILTFTPPFAEGATLYVAPHGDNDARGTREQPLRSISAAAELARPGDIVYVLEGVYRERVAPPRGGEPGKPITYRGEPGKRVFIKGSEVWTPDWSDDGDGVYSAHPDAALFTDLSTEYLDSHNPLKVELASTPWHREGLREAERKQAGDDRIGRADEQVVFTLGQVFVNSAQFREVPLREELESGTWWYDDSADRVYIHFGHLDPTEQLVELTTRRRLFAPKKRGLGHIVIEGFIFEHCGNQYPTNFWENDSNAQKGAVGTEAGHHWTIRRNVIRHSKTLALDVGRVDRHSSGNQPHDTLVEENYILENGSAGILTNGSTRLVIRNNVILRNNTRHFYGVKRWEQAGIKAHQFNEGLIDHNYIAYNNDMSGIWLDNQFPGSRVTRNVSYANGERGIFLEMSDYPFDTLLVDRNILIANEENGLYIHDASGATFMHNLIANTPASEAYGQGLYVRQVSARTKTYHHSFYGNLFIGNARNVEVNYPAARSGRQRFDFNLYGVAANSSAFAINSRSDVPSPWSSEEFGDLVVADLGVKGSAEGIDVQQRRVELSAGNWRKFWKGHGMTLDGSSQFAPQSRVDYQPDKQQLTIYLEAAPPRIPSETYRSIVSEFPGEEMSPEEGEYPGPFGQLRAGANPFDIWDGLPILNEGELPPAEWTQ